MQEAFLKLKEYLASPPVLCKPQLGTPLCLYFTVTERAISSVMVQDQDQMKTSPLLSELHRNSNDRPSNLHKPDVAGRMV